MSPTIRNVLVGCGALLVVAVAGAALAGVPATVLAPMITGSATVLASVGAVIYAKHQEQKREIEQRQHARKAEIYQEFMDYWFGVLKAKRDLPEKERKRTSDAYNKSFPKKLVTWSSEAVIKEYGDYMGFDQHEDKDIFEFEKLLFAVRADLGHSNEGLKKGDLLRVFLKGVDTRLREEDNR